MKLFDLHCDTPYELFKNQKELSSNDLHISLEKSGVFEKYVQCAAVWSDYRLSDAQCLKFFREASAYFEKEAPYIIKSRRDLENSCRDAFILTVEDSRLICSDTDNIEFLFQRGVRVMTLLWGKKSSIGCAWDETGPLTSLGKETLEKCFSIGIIPDISHSNDETASYILERAANRGLPVIATHSNSRTVCQNSRNLRDSHAKCVAKLGGIIGISLYPPHLRGERADISDIIRHIQHYLNLCGKDAVCLGCDFDGIDSTPDNINDISGLVFLYDALCTTFGTDIAECIFYNNAYNFFINNLPQ